MAQTIVGLDVGSWAVKIAVIESTLRRFSLIQFKEQRVARDARGDVLGDSLVDAIRAGFRGVGDRDAIITAMPGSRAMTREIELPFAEDRRIRSVLGFQLEGTFPRPLDELVTDYYLLERHREGARLLCAAVTRQHMAELLSNLKDAAADPRIVTLGAHVLAKLAPQLDIGGAGQAVALVDMGHTTTSICIVRDGGAEMVRTLGRGGHDVTLALMSGLGVDYGEAERVKHEGVRLDGMPVAGVSDAEALERAEIVSQAVAPIFRDVALTLHAHASRPRRRGPETADDEEAIEALLASDDDDGDMDGVEGVYFFGGSARMPGLADNLAEALDLPVAPPTFSYAQWSKLPGDPMQDLVMPQAVALGLRFLDDEPAHSMNLRQGELAYVSGFRAMRGRVAWLSVLLVLILAVFFGRQYVHYQSLEENHEKLVASLEDFSQHILGEEKSDFDYVLRRVMTPPEEEDVSVFPEMTAFRAFYEISAAQDVVNAIKPEGSEESAEDEEGSIEGKKTPDLEKEEVEEGDGEAKSEDAEEPPKDEGFKVELRQIQLDLKVAYIKGEANNIEAVEAFNSELAKNQCFTGVETQKTDMTSFGNRQGWLRFDIRVDVRCSAPPEEA